MVFAGLLPCQFFAAALSEASNSLIANANLIGKVYFPRLIVPTATVVVAFIDFLVSFLILVGMMIWYHFLPRWQIVLLPVFVAIAFFASLVLGFPDYLLKRQIPRLSLRHSVPRPVRTLCLPSGLQQQRDPGTMATPLQRQPNGWRD